MDRGFGALILTELRNDPDEGFNKNYYIARGKKSTEKQGEIRKVAGRTGKRIADEPLAVENRRAA
jgi:hypothetical protein